MPKYPAKRAGLANLSNWWLKKPPWKFNFLDIFVILSSSKPEKGIQNLFRFFCYFKPSDSHCELFRDFGPKVVAFANCLKSLIFKKETSPDRFEITAG